jgi:hypothetical protein
MGQANVNDPGSIERIYAFEAFERDASQNARGGTAILHGLTVMSPPDAEGGFDVVPAKRQTGESEPGREAAFVPAILTEAGPETNEAPGDHSRRRLDYQAFVTRVLAAAREVRPTLQSADARLQGFHGG